MLELVRRITGWSNRNKLLDQPIFILSPPRSGSTLLFEEMTQFEDIIHFGHESDFIWWKCFPYENMSDPSDHVGKDLSNSENISMLRNMTFNALMQREGATGRIVGKRYLDKTIANSFHLEFIEKAFPAAQFILLVRDPRDNISSMIEGWPHITRFGKAQLTPVLNEIQGRTIEHWTYPAPPGWQQHVIQPLEEICAWSWQQHIEYVLHYFSQSGRSFHLVKYEELLANPRESLGRIASKFRLNLSEKVLEYAVSPKLSATTVTPPRKDKWRELHYREIMAVLPMIEQTATKLGYHNLRGGG